MFTKRPRVGEVYFGPRPEGIGRSWFEVLSVGSKEVVVCSPSWFPRPRLRREHPSWPVSLDFFSINYRLDRDRRGRLVRRPGDATVRAMARQAAILKRVFDGSTHGE